MKIYANKFFLKNFILLASTFWSLITIWVNFYIWCDVRCSTFFLSFACEYAVFIAPFVVKIFLPHLIVLAHVENQLTIKLIVEYYHLNHTESFYQWMCDVFPFVRSSLRFLTIFFSFQSICFTLLMLVVIFLLLLSLKNIFCDSFYCLS